MLVSFGVQKRFSFMNSLIIDLSTYANVILFRKSFPVPTSSRLFYIFSSFIFTMSGHILRSLIYLKLSFVTSMGSIQIVLHVDNQFDHYLLLKMFTFQSVFLASLFKIKTNKQTKVSIGVYISRSSIQLHWSMYLFLFQYHDVFISIALYYSLRSEMVMPPAVCLFVLWGHNFPGGLLWWKQQEVPCAA